MFSEEVNLVQAIFTNYESSVLKNIVYTIYLSGVHRTDHVVQCSWYRAQSGEGTQQGILVLCEFSKTYLLTNRVYNI